jgi:23S rRNA (cytosine1962-C5)-methyltransferase
MRIQLARPAAVAVRRGHPWVYRGGIVRAPETLAAGTAVDLVDEEGYPLGHGLWDPAAPIAVRVFGGDASDKLDAVSLARHIERAIARRDGFFGDDTTAYRLCNGEGDRVPGFVLDRYGDVGVIRLDTEAWTPHLAQIAEALEASLGARGVRSLALRLSAPGPDGKKLQRLTGAPLPDRQIVLERGMRMEVDLAQGQKTGAFLDQRENRARVRALARGRRRVLNLFSYAGGFSIAAALGGALATTSVDIAAAAHAAAQRTFRENGVDPSGHTFVSADAFMFLEQAAKRGERYDLVISDPPSFAPSERAKPRAESAYRRLHGAIGAVLAEGAILCAASCSSHVSAEEFLSTLDDAALGRTDLTVREVHGQPLDHPSLACFSEGRYLKFVVLG